jgi:gliding motility-associated-like protein
MIFDRWNEVVFQSFDPDSQWDGKLGGKELPDGVYLYHMEYRDIKNKPHFENGTITLLR